MSGAFALPFAQAGPVIPDFGRGDECIRTNGKFCAEWFVDNFEERFLPRVGEHIKMTVIAVVRFRCVPSRVVIVSPARARRTITDRPASSSRSNAWIGCPSSCMT